MRTLMIAAAVAGSLVHTLPAMAATETFTFNGDCLNCGSKPNGTGELVLSDYAYGTAISAANFVMFRYNGSDYVPSFTLLPGKDLSVSGRLYADMTGSLNLDDLVNGFFVVRSGSWQSGSDEGTSDFGAGGRFSRSATVSAAPEPGTWALTITGVGIAGSAMRRRRKVSCA